DERGYAPDDVGAVGRAYELALRLFTCVYRGSGKPFLAHAVGTASILASLRARMPVIAAGLLHAAYTHGEFGNGWRGVSPPKRREVRRAVGEEVESLVARYTELAWHAGTIAGIRDNLGDMTSVERGVLLVRLANALEGHLDPVSAVHARWRRRGLAPAAPDAAVTACRCAAVARRRSQ